MVIACYWRSIETDSYLENANDTYRNKSRLFGGPELAVIRWSFSIALQKRGDRGQQLSVLCSCVMISKKNANNCARSLFFVLVQKSEKRQGENESHFKLGLCELLSNSHEPVIEKGYAKICRLPLRPTQITALDNSFCLQICAVCSF